MTRRRLVEGHRPTRRREAGLLLSALLHGSLLIGITGWPASVPRSLRAPVPRNEPVQVEIVALSDIRDPVFDFDIEKIGTRIDRLFPFNGPIPFASITHTARAGGGANMFAMAPHLAAPSPALRLSPLEMQFVLDASWSRRHRWDSFQQILDLVLHFDPQQGDLPTLLRRYVSDNLLQPFNASRSPDPKVWGLLSVAADHFEFVQFIRTFVERVPSSKVTTELLFLLDKLVQANLQAALSVFTLDTSDGIEWTTRASPKGAEILVALKRDQERALGTRGIWDESAIARAYDDVRVGILEHLIRTTPQGYRINDARFLIGEIYWQQGRRADARDVWSRIEPDSSDDYFMVYSDVRANLAAETRSRAPIDSALNKQTRRWLHASSQRLRHFGFTADRF
jgi:hypothetical protein